MPDITLRGYKYKRNKYTKNNHKAPSGKKTRQFDILVA